MTQRNRGGAHTASHNAGGMLVHTNTQQPHDGEKCPGDRLRGASIDAIIRRLTSGQKLDPLAQSVEHLTFNQGVRSSSLRRITIFRFIHAGVDLRAGVAELADAPDLGSGARKAYGFKSLRPHHTIAFLPAGVAHLVERSLAKAEVAGSSPVSRSIHKRSYRLPAYEWRLITCNIITVCRYSVAVTH